MATTRMTGTRRTFSARRFIGKDVYDTAGSHVGECEDLIIDVQTAAARWAIITAGQILGMGGRDYVVPIQTVSIEPGSGRLFLSFVYGQLRNAPLYVRESPPPWHDEQWAANVYAYYGMDPSGRVPEDPESGQPGHGRTSTRPEDSGAASNERSTPREPRDVQPIGWKQRGGEVPADTSRGAGQAESSGQAAMQREGAQAPGATGQDE